MKLRGAEHYSIGLDIGTGSVGWAVVDSNRELLKFKGKPTWGSRLFSSASTAAATRLARGQRRRYDRRRQRLDWLQEFFFEEMNKVDPDFFTRLNQSRLIEQDRAGGCSDYRWPLFNDPDFNESDYYELYPTIYHLRAALIEGDEKADIRLIYLAFHNIVKSRGNFLYQDQPSLSAKNANVKSAVEKFVFAIRDWCDELEVEYPLPLNDEVAVADIRRALEDKTIRKRKERQEILSDLLKFKSAEGKIDKACGKEMSAAMLGYKAKFNKILCDSSQKTFALSDEEAVAEFLESCPDSFLGVFESLQMIYSSFILTNILKGANGATISACKKEAYEQYGRDLATLKTLVREYAPEEYDGFFRGETYKGSKEYDPSKAKGYTRYNLGLGKTGSGCPATKKYDYEAFKKDIVNLFEETPAVSDPRYIDMIDRLEEQDFLRKLKTSDNGSIPYQLHLEEMEAIIEKQAKYYPFLSENRKELTSLVSFRIPYYVGPLTTKNAAKSSDGQMRFAWSSRREGMEDAPVRPWNWEEIIDKDKSAEAFIRRMTGTCTYLQGEPVLPKCSILYEEFCVLNELNGARWTQDGDKTTRFSYDLRYEIMEQLFKAGGSVSHTRLQNWMAQNGIFNAHVEGTQDENGFVSKLGSYSFFRKLLDVEKLSSKQIEMAEEIILWNTIFEDRDILREKIKDKYGDVLSGEQVGKICRKRFTGWGRLSKKFLCELKVTVEGDPKSIMGILREGDPNNSKQLGRAMTLMEVLRDDSLGFGKLVEEANAERARNCGGLAIDDMQGSPALRRGVNQALRIIREIKKIAGSDPAEIYIESTREEDELNKRQRTTRRYRRIKDALEPFKKEDPTLWQELVDLDSQEMANDRLALYFIQRGRCMYTGAPLDIGQLSSYQIDHILPQSLIKDDSIENLALVLSSANQEKTDKLTLSPGVISKMRGMWRALLEADLIGKKKYENLTRTEFREGQIKGFIARQLVETSQIIKFVQQFLRQEYPNTRIVTVKAAVSSGLKDTLEIVKCRQANDYHHAHDAYIACCVGSFINSYYSDFMDNPVRMAHVVKTLLREHSEQLKKTRRMPGSSGFFVSSFMRQHVDDITGEIWEPEVEAAKIKRTIDFKSCFITRMPFELTGAFWDQTIYSPKHLKGSGLPLKKGLSPEVYGSYSREQFAYFFVYKARGGRGREEFVFAPVPVSIAAKVESDDRALESFATEHAKASGKTFVGIAKRKIPKYQLIEINGDRFYVTGAKEMRNATEIAFPQKELQVLKGILEGKGSNSADQLFETICRFASRHSKRSERMLGLGEEALADRFAGLSNEDKSLVLSELIANLNGVKNKVDLRPIGKGGHVGALSIAYSKEITSGSLAFIDVSVTGMFERKCCLEL